MSDRILVPVDGSPLSRRALEVACEEYEDDEIVALHVIDPFDPAYSVYGIETDLPTEPPHGSEEWYERATEHSEALLEELADVADDYGVTIHTESTVGRPDREILQYVEDEDVDHVIVGSHGRDEGARILLGSVTEAVAFRSPVRVSLIR